ncbi:patatin-like phospholipase family protein [Acuticoccus kandeliae]|uniref:patatin-like phospholipase family protein n=1 Tax=Acuticoccus kandeliae TaxID=2073160 RepID=UPI000D3E3011|nr:patatin-like phospholipase family protein [Acuticoccus kandeliae]
MSAPFVRVMALFLALVVAACGSVGPRIEYSAQDQLNANVVGMPEDIRMWADAPLSEYKPGIRLLVQNWRRTGIAPKLLALSGGADDGAYGAGFLHGWSEAGDRPQFSIVSGISTGALIAPYAFLGSHYDDKLREIFTEIDRGDIFVLRGLSGLFGSGVADSTPLKNMIANHVTPALMAEIAKEHAKGRRLLVATTNLDAQRTMVWDMGTIATIGTPRALEVFRQVLLASASVPGIFPPVLIDSQAAGHRFNELHVDGGATVQVFTLPTAVLVSRNEHMLPRGSAIYMIINNKLAPDFEVVRASALPVASRSFSTIIKSSARQTVVETFNFAKERDTKFRLTYIGNNFDAESKYPFDREYMNKLYDYGVERGRSGTAWLDRPPFER